jgi:hypothetical protein
MTPISAGLSD